MADIIGSDAHVDQELLGLHYLDALDPAESDVIHQHLEQCPACQAQADEVIDTVAALALLGTDDLEPSSTARPESAVRSESAAGLEFPARSETAVGGESVGSAEAEVGVMPAERGNSAAFAASGKSGPARNGSGSVRPARGGGSTRPGEKRRRTGKLLRTGALLALVLVVAGLGLATLVRSPQGGPTPILTAAAEATDQTTGASASVTVSDEDDDGVTIRATVSGLREGTDYLLYAVTSDGGTQEVTRWTGTAAVQDVSGRLPVRLDDLSFFTVALAGGGPVVSVYLPGVPVAPTR